MRRLAALVVLVVTAALVYGLRVGVGAVPPLGQLLDPADGLYRTARRAAPPAGEATLALPGLTAPVTVAYDDRGVPHLYAEDDLDAVRALGYVTARDRLFQMDFVARVAAGRLSEAFGARTVATDRFLRSTGMEWGAQKNWQRIKAERGIEYDLVTAYAAGVNAYRDALAPEDLPLEFRLLGYAPGRFAPLDVLRVLQYMTYDLTFNSDAAAYGALRDSLAGAAYAALYPRHPAGLYVPIIPPEEAWWNGGGAGARAAERVSGAKASAAQTPSSQTPSSQTLTAEAWDAARRTVADLIAQQEAWAGTPLAGFRAGKGSNNWAVAGRRSATGAPILAGDMHLGLSLPAIWYEAHLVTPTMNTYGVTVPGAPLPVEAFNERVAWAFTNTGADQIDHLALELDATGTRYRFGDAASPDGGFRDLRLAVDTIRVKGGAAVRDTVRYSHHGPIVEPPNARPGAGPVALRWVAHTPSTTLKALWGMNRAADLDAFEAALRDWDTPMQNVLYADLDGRIAIRSTGHLPVRAAGHGRGLLDGTTDAFAWTGRVPFEELPFARDPAQGFLTSTNQKPTDAAYPHYLGHDWRDGYRSLRIDALLRGKQAHTVDDLKAYQADVVAPQHLAFTPLLRGLGEGTPPRDGLSGDGLSGGGLSGDGLSGGGLSGDGLSGGGLSGGGLSARADTLRRMLVAWDGAMTVDRPEPLVFDIFFGLLHRATWDEPVFARLPDPEDAVLLDLLRTSLDTSATTASAAAAQPDSARAPLRWLDVQATPDVTEDAAALLARTLEQTADSLAAGYGWTPAAWRWGDHHTVVFRHLTQNAALRPLWRGPVEYPGFASTLSPARGRQATHSASWRVVVDFAGERPTAYGIYPGGQSGDPLDPRLYDLHLQDYVAFEHYRLRTPATPEALDAAHTMARLTLTP